MLTKIKEFQKQARSLGRDENNIEEFKLWLEANEKSASAVNEWGKRVSPIHEKLVELYDELKDEWIDDELRGDFSVMGEGGQLEFLNWVERTHPEDLEELEDLEE